ncbi:glycosyl hydrolase family 16 protein [Nitzschia inconspicua]|uniref:Glycosyl hydrolase family 16 protein n=1 Tax=Nitzschia inconspicua TaxID=303405 RepID=A0A9K3M3H1_9STRA|nr:glycosyl hydrolase family 16 protein [Nitzschia inconspicua]
MMLRTLHFALLLSGLAFADGTTSHNRGRHLRASGDDHSTKNGVGKERRALEEDGIFVPTFSQTDGASSPIRSTIFEPNYVPRRIATTPACQSILWSDEFSGSSGRLESNIWNYDEGRGNNGWGNSELQSYTRNNARVQDGKLIITVKEQDDGTGRTFTSARIHTQDKLEVLYGTLEARIKLPASLENGLWPAFWTLGGNFREVSWPACGEIDVMEMGSEEARLENAIHKRVTSAVHWESGDTRASFGERIATSNPLNDGEFHLFRLEWTSSRISTFVDDNPIMRFDISPEACTDCEEFRQPHFLILNVAVGGTFPGILNEASVTAPLPAEMEVDYVRVCDNGETVLSGSVIEEQVEYGFDCGLPDSCTTSALNNYAGSFRCGSRIRYLLRNGLTEEEACRKVAFEEFPDYCGVCYEQPLDCNVPKTCTRKALSADAAGFPCGDRINFLIGKGQSEAEACRVVAIEEFPNECGACAPFAKTIDCGQPKTCTAAVLQADADGFPCGDRIQYLINSGGRSELEACDQVARGEFPRQCDASGCYDGDRIDFLVKI